MGDDVRGILFLCVANSARSQVAEFGVDLAAHRSKSVLEIAPATSCERSSFWQSAVARGTRALAIASFGSAEVHRVPVGSPRRGPSTRTNIDAHLRAPCTPTANRWPLPPFPRQWLGAGAGTNAISSTISR